MILDKSSDLFVAAIISLVSKFNNVLNWQWHNKTLKLLKSLLRVDFSENKNVELRNDFRFIVCWRLFSLSQWSVVCHNNNHIKLSPLSVAFRGLDWIQSTQWECVHSGQARALRITSFCSENFITWTKDLCKSWFMWELLFDDEWKVFSEFPILRSFTRNWNPIYSWCEIMDEFYSWCYSVWVSKKKLIWNNFRIDNDSSNYDEFKLWTNIERNWIWRWMQLQIG